jgi:hypothetical protein
MIKSEIDDIIADCHSGLFNKNIHVLVMFQLCRAKRTLVVLEDEDNLHDHLKVIKVRDASLVFFSCMLI